MGLAHPAIMGQTAPGSGGDTGSFLMWIGILIVVVIVGTVVLLTVRKRMTAAEAQDRAGFSTMEEMRAMVARGEMTQEEYEQVRKAMIDKIRQGKPTQNQNGSPNAQGEADAGGGRSSEGNRSSSFR